MVAGVFRIVSNKGKIFQTARYFPVWNFLHGLIKCLPKHFLTTSKVIQSCKSKSISSKQLKQQPQTDADDADKEDDNDEEEEEEEDGNDNGDENENDEDHVPPAMRYSERNAGHACYL